MKAFILAAGPGTRLRPLTDDLPKCLLPIRGVPLLQIWLENCRVAGVDEVLINAHAHAAKIQAFCAAHADAVKIHVIEEEQLLGSAGTLAQNRDFVTGDSSFFVLYGDVLTNASLCDMACFHRRSRSSLTLGICQVPDPERCGIVTIDDSGTVRSFVEKPARPESNWAFSGIMIATPAILDSIPGTRPADIAFDLLPLLAGQMTAYKIPEFLMDIGTLHNYTLAQTSWPGLRHEN